MKARAIQPFANPSVVRDRRREFRCCTMRMLEGFLIFNADSSELNAETDAPA